MTVLVTCREKRKQTTSEDCTPQSQTKSTYCYSWAASQWGRHGSSAFAYSSTGLSPKHPEHPWKQNRKWSLIGSGARITGNHFVFMIWKIRKSQRPVNFWQPSPPSLPQYVSESHNNKKLTDNRITVGDQIQRFIPVDSTHNSFSINVTNRNCIRPYQYWQNHLTWRTHKLLVLCVSNCQDCSA